MVIVGTYTPEGVFYRGVEHHPDGTITIQDEWLIPFERNRYIRQATGADILVHTNDIRFLRRPAKVTLRVIGFPASARQRFMWAKSWIRAIPEQADPLAIAMGNFQLLHPDVDPQHINWHPQGFFGMNLGPAPGNIMAVAAALGQNFGNGGQ